jgi:hypothetical protein
MIPPGTFQINDGSHRSISFQKIISWRKVTTRESGEVVLVVCCNDLRTVSRNAKEAMGVGCSALMNWWKKS